MILREKSIINKLFGNGLIYTTYKNGWGMACDVVLQTLIQNLRCSPRGLLENPPGSSDLPVVGFISFSTFSGQRFKDRAGIDSVDGRIIQTLIIQEPPHPQITMFLFEGS